jgi:hypothetical protein
VPNVNLTAFAVYVVHVQQYICPHVDMQFS